MHWTTTPPQKMPDEEILNHVHRVYLKVNFEKVDWMCLGADLSEYYNWAWDHNVLMEHNVVRTGDPATIMFVFDKAENAMAFKLRWA